MREEFEKLPHILELMQYVICFDGLKYVSENQRTADYLNGAWYAFQEQQKKINKAIEYLDSIEGLVWYEQIKDILKSTH